MEKRLWSIIIVMLVLGVPTIWLVGSPLFIDRTVEEKTVVVVASRVLASGHFVDADSIHKGSGSVDLIETKVGRYLRLEEFHVTNGPELHLYLAVHPQPGDRPDIVVQGFVDLGKLKGNVGDQNYAIPAEVEVERYQSVVIYSQSFQIIFAIAPLTHL